MKIQVTPHTIQIIRDTDINAGEYNVSKCTFEFSNEYQELSNVAVFTNCEGTCVEQAITNNECIIPYEMLENPGQVKLGVYGYEVEEETLVLRYSPTAQYFNVKNGSYAEGEQPTPPSPSIVEQLQAQITDNRNDINDLQEDVGNIKEDITELQGDVSTLQETKADKSEIPTKVSELDNDSGYIDKNVDDLTNYTPTNELSAVATSGSYNDLEDKPDLSVYATTQSLNDEISNRRIADNNLQGQIDAITSSSDVKDIVGTYQELLEYDTSTLGNDDIIKVLEDSTHNNAMTYYRWVISGSSGSWEYIGQEGPYYTKSQANDLLSEKVGFTDYATGSKGGVIKRSTTYATNMSNDGVLYASTKTYADYPNLNGNAFISKGTLENVVTGKQLTNKTYVDNADNLKEDKSNKVTSINENSTDTQYPSAKCVYDSQLKQDKEIEKAKMVYNALPKVTGEGESVSLDNTAECPMEIKIKPSELYQANAVLPSGYTQVEYITNDTSSYIDSGYTPTLNTKARVKFMPLATSTTGFFGARKDPYRFCCTTFTSGTEFAFAMTNNSWVSNREKYSLNTIYDCIAENGKYSVNETEYTKALISEWGNCGTFKLAGLNVSGTPFPVSTRFYLCQIWENNVMVRNLVPCYRNSDNEIGMYDLVNNVFYTKSGDGTLSKGNNVTLPSPDYPQEIHSISGENTIIVTNKDNTQEQSLPLNLGDLEYCKIGDYEDEFFKNSGKNLFSGWIKGKGLNSTTGVEETNVDKSVSDYIPVDFSKNANYYVSGLTSTLNSFVNAYNSSKQSLGRTGGTAREELSLTSSSFTSGTPQGTGDVAYIRITQYVSESGNIDIVDNLKTMLNSGTTALLYEPYGSGDWYLKKNIGKVVLDGSEDWKLALSDTPNWYYYFSYTTGIASGSTGISNYYKWGNIGNNNTNQGIIVLSGYFRIRYGTEDTVANFKTWLSTHNTIVYYPLATPTYILLNETLQEQLENIYNHTNSYNEQTNLSQQNNDLPFVLKLSAIRDLSTL